MRQELDSRNSVNKKGNDMMDGRLLCLLVLCALQSNSIFPCLLNTSISYCFEAIAE
jgi:hypothetical protein